MAYIYAQMLKSDREEKKYMIRFYDESRKQKKVIHFGQKGADDFTKTKDVEQKNRYRNRHDNSRENHDVPDTPASASWHILWNKPTLTASYNDYLKRFGLKKY